MEIPKETVEKIREYMYVKQKTAQIENELQTWFGSNGYVREVYGNVYKRCYKSFEITQEPKDKIVYDGQVFVVSESYPIESGCNTCKEYVTTTYTETVKRKQ